MTEPGMSGELGSRHRLRVLRLVVAVAMVSILVGVVATTFVRSPQQVIADAAPPERTLLTAPVERRALADTIALRGEVVQDRPMPFAPGAPSLAARPVVTASHLRVGTRVHSGAVLLEVAGRPAIALEGEIPMYRDIAPGDVGPDVAQLQRALRAIGGTVGDEDGLYGKSTQAAVTALYDALGYRPPAAAPSDDVRPTGEESGEREGTEADGTDAARLDGPGHASHTGGPIVPMAEIVFVARLPAKIVSADAHVGQDLPQPAAMLASRRPKVIAYVAPADADRVTPGMRAHVSTSGGKDLGDGTVLALRKAVHDDVDGLVVPVVVGLRRTVPLRLVDHTVQVTIDAESRSVSSLVVPLSAVFSHADGSTGVQVLADDVVTEVDVEVGNDADGFTTVTPLVDGSLAEGDLVVVGQP